MAVATGVGVAAVSAKVVSAGAKTIFAMIGLEEFLSGLLQDSRNTGKKPPEGFDQNMEVKPQDAKLIGNNRGRFKLSHGLTWIRGPITGKCPTIDPTDHYNIFEYARESSRDEYFSIKYLGDATREDGRYKDTFVYAGDQASVKVYNKKRIGKNEQFSIRVFEVKGVEYCYIRCKRDQEHWYVDKKGKVRHRNRSQQGFMLDVFRLHRLDQDNESLVERTNEPTNQRYNRSTSPQQESFLDCSYQSEHETVPLNHIV